MKQFVLICRDKPGAMALRAETRPSHLAYMGEANVKILLAGPLLNEGGEPVGSLIIVEAADKAAAERFAESDPYKKAGLFQSVSVEQYKTVMGAFAPSS